MLVFEYKCISVTGEYKAVLQPSLHFSGLLFSQVFLRGNLVRCIYFPDWKRNKLLWNRIADFWSDTTETPESIDRIWIHICKAEFSADYVYWCNYWCNTVGCHTSDQMILSGHRHWVMSRHRVVKWERAEANTIIKFWGPGLWLPPRTEPGLDARLFELKEQRILSGTFFQFFWSSTTEKVHSTVHNEQHQHVLKFGLGALIQRRHEAITAKHVWHLQKQELHQSICWLSAVEMVHKE